MNTKNNSYSTELLIKCSIEKAFAALSSNIGDWWGDQDKPVQNPEDVFTMSWGEPWYQFRVVAYEPNHKITWECIDAKQIIGDLEGVEKEWVGTQLQWTLKESRKQETELQFIHQGLVPEFICYDFCSNTWDRFIAFNLKKYLESSSQ